MEQRRQGPEEEPLLPDRGDMQGQGARPVAAGTVSLGGAPAIGLASAVLYGGTAVAMNFINKYSMQIYPLPNVVMILQMAVTWAIVQPLMTAGYLTFPSFSWRKCRELFWITALYTGNTCFALFGLKTLNIPMYNTLKRLTPVMVLTCKAVLFRRWPRLEISLSVLLVVAGCVVAGLGDLTFDLLGYLFAFGSCTMQAAYLLLVEFQGADGISTSELLYYNAITSLPFLALITAATGEMRQALPQYHDAVSQHGAASVVGTLLSCAVMGCLLNYALFLCTVNNSALTTTIVGVLKGVVAVFLGFFLLGGVKFHWLNVSGITLNTAGGIWYTVIKYNEKRGRKAVLASTSPSSDPLPAGDKELMSGHGSGADLLATASSGPAQGPAGGGREVAEAFVEGRGGAVRRHLGVV